MVQRWPFCLTKLVGLCSVAAVSELMMVVGNCGGGAVWFVAREMGGDVCSIGSCGDDSSCSISNCSIGFCSIGMDVSWAGLSILR